MSINDIKQEMAELRAERLRALREADDIQDRLNQLQRLRQQMALREHFDG